MEIGDTWYRYEGEYWQEDYAPEPKLILQEFKVLKLTPCGAWIAPKGYGSPLRFILKDSVKQYASPTRQRAMEKFIRRKMRYEKILEQRLEETRALLAKARG